MAWWTGLSRVRRGLALLYVGGSAALALLGELTGEPLPFLLAALVTAPVGMVAIVAMYPTYAIVSGTVSLFVGTSAERHDRFTHGAMTPVSVLLFGAAAIANLWALDTWRAGRSVRAERLAAPVLPDTP